MRAAQRGLGGFCRSWAFLPLILPWIGEISHPGLPGLLRD